MSVSEQSIISELEDAVRTGTADQRVNTLRRVTDLFLRDEQRLSEEQVKVFDDVLGLLVTRVETRARAELSHRLALVDNAPSDVIQKLALDDEISVAGDVLIHSKRVTTDTLVQVARTKGQDHLFAMSGRDGLPESVTDVLVQRGEKRVVRNLAGNATAQFSETGYAGMVAKASGDDQLAELLGVRVDLPLKFLRDLLQRATDAVRARLVAIAPPALQEEINRVLSTIAGSMKPALADAHRDFSLVDAMVKEMQERGELNEQALIRFIRQKMFDHLAAALALLNGVATDLIAKALEGPRADLILIPCRGAGLNWNTVEKILTQRPGGHPINDAILNVARQDFGRLSVPTAQRTLRFWQLHNKIGK
ncbi:MAG: DUF2336 domain-containing protein [Bradyrhizobium sp.]|nr:DUF2336 domain-containing protein [Bradyrhizobium sp.]